MCGWNHSWSEDPLNSSHQMKPPVDDLGIVPPAAQNVIFDSAKLLLFQEKANLTPMLIWHPEIMTISATMMCAPIGMATMKRMLTPKMMSPSLELKTPDGARFCQC